MSSHWSLISHNSHNAYPEVSVIQNSMHISINRVIANWRKRDTLNAEVIVFSLIPEEKIFGICHANSH